VGLGDGLGEGAGVGSGVGLGEGSPVGVTTGPEIDSNSIKPRRKENTLSESSFGHIQCKNANLVDLTWRWPI
jgi:hypothetical protein